MSPQLQTTPSTISGLQLASATAVIGPQPQTTPFAFNIQPSTENAPALVGPTSMSPQLQTTPSTLSDLQLESATAVIGPQPQTIPFTFNIQPTTANPSALVGPTAMSPQLQTSPSALSGLQLASTTAVIGPQPQTTPFAFNIQPSTENAPALVGPTSMSPQLQTTPSALSRLQLASATAIMSPQPQTTPFTFNSQPTTANPSALIGPTASPQLQTTPSALGGLQLESALHVHGLTRPQSQPPRPDTPMTQFLKLTSSFDFSDINFNSNPSSDSQPTFGMDQHWNLNGPSFPSALPTSSTMTTAGASGFIPPNSPVEALSTATNTLPSDVTDGTSGTFGTPGTAKEDRSKKRKSYEERNAHCILPDGSRRPRKSRRIEGAEDENMAGPKKRNTNANKKGKVSKGKK